MKKIYLITSLLGLTSLTFSQAQLPNASLDNWETVVYETTSYEQPITWEPGNICVNDNLTSTASCQLAATKSMDSNEGSYSAKVVNDGIFGLLLLDYDFKDKPKSLEVQVKRGLLPNDDAKIKVFLHNGELFDDPTVIGSGEITLTETSSVYEKVMIDITYANTQQYEHITIQVVVNEAKETKSSFVLVDDFKLNYGPVGLVEKSTVKSISINPNPVSNVVNFNEELAQFDILSLNGEVVVTGVKVESVDISSLNKGMYILKGTDSNGELVASRFVKQ